MSIPIFNNKPNEFFKMQYGGLKMQYFISRAVAVDGYIIAFGIDKSPRILVVKRSKTMMDEPLKFCVPCGYLDWNESTYDAMVREVYEETGLYIPKYEKNIIFDNDKQPFWVNSNPKNNRQNVVMNYIIVLDFIDNRDSFPHEVVDFKTNECESIEWLSLSDFYQRDSSEWAFKHDENIQLAFKYFNKNF